MNKKEFRVLIKHCFLMGKNTTDAKKWLDKRYEDSAPGKSTVIEWYSEFKRGRTSTEDAERSGRPKSAVVPENIKKVHKLVLKDRKMKLREIADTLTISEGSVFTILHENLRMRKLFSKWVPRLLTPDQKQQRIDDSERCLELFKRNKIDFLNRYVTMDKIWIHFYTPESATGESRPKRPKNQKSAGKVMLSVFWDVNGILFIDFLDKDKIMNSEYYMALLDRLTAEIMIKRPYIQDKKVLFHHDNFSCHESMETMAKLKELHFELLPHPPYSPDLAPSEYWLFAETKKMLQGKKFNSNEEVINETEAYYESIDKSYYKKAIEKLEKRWNECITLEGEYIEE